MRSKKLNTNSFHVRKTRINRKNTFRTKKRVKRFTQKNKRALQYGGNVEENVEEENKGNVEEENKENVEEENKGNVEEENDDEEEDDDDEELTEEEQKKAEEKIDKLMEEPRELTTIEKAVKSRKKLEDFIENKINEEGYNVDSIIKLIQTKEYKTGYNLFKRKKNNYTTLYSLGRAKKNKDIMKETQKLIKEKNPNIDSAAIKSLSNDFIDYLQKKIVNKEMGKYDALIDGLQEEGVRKAIEKDKLVSEKLVDHMVNVAKSGEGITFKENSGLIDGTGKLLVNFTELSLKVIYGSVVMAPTIVMKIAGVFSKPFKDRKKYLKYYFQQVNKENGNQFTNDQIRKDAALILKLFELRTSKREEDIIHSKWFSLGDSKASLFPKGKTSEFLKKNFLSKLKGEQYESCSLIKELDTSERGLSLSESFKSETLRKFADSVFFKKEDDYFRGVLNKNLKAFCFDNKETGDDMEYSRFCYRINSCLKKPNLLHELLHDAIDAKATKRMFEQLPSSSQDSLVERIQKNNIDTFKEKLGDEEDVQGKKALVLTLLQDENIRNLAKFLKQVIIQTFIDYKSSGKKAPKGVPKGAHTGNIVVEPYFDDIFKLLKEKVKKEEEKKEEEEDTETESEEEETESKNNNGNQSGGADNSKKKVSKTSYKQIKDEIIKKAGEKAGEKFKMYTASQLEKITEDDLYQGLKDCDKKDLIKKDHDKKIDKGTDEMGDEFDEDDDGIESVGEGMETPKLLYILMGSLIVVGVIESGFLDAPTCLTHTLI